MSIRYKLLFFFLVQHFLFLFIALLLSEFIVRPYSLNIENKNAHEKISQIKNVFDREMQYLSLLNVQWSVWDDTYAFMEDKNQHYIQSNFSPSVLEMTKLNHIELFDISGKSVQKEDNEQIDISALLDENSLLKKRYMQWSQAEEIQAMYGVMNFKEKIAFFALHPVLPGTAKGPNRGMLLMLRLVDTDMLDSINKSTNSEVSLSRLEDASSLNSLKKEKIISEAIDTQTLKVSSYLSGTSEEHGILIEIYLQREFMIESEKLILFLFIFGGSLGLISFIISYILLKREVVNPLTSLGEHIEEIKENESFSVSPLATREDEIGILAKEFNTLISKIDERNRSLAKVARIDALTGLANRLDLEERFENERRQSCREKQDMSILMLDIDYFKKYNDTYGHVKGDIVLTCIAQAIKDSGLRPRDYVARYGGEEFIVILPKTHVDGSVIVAKRIIENVEKLEIEHMSSLLDKKIVSISIGCLTLVVHKDETQEFIINLADEALYTAKENGRNRFHVYQRNNA